MTKITESDIDAIYDAIEIINVCREVLSQGNADSRTQGSVSWLLGTTAKRIGDTLTIIEKLQYDQTTPASTDAAELELLSEVMALTAKFNRRRQSEGMV